MLSAEDLLMLSMLVAAAEAGESGDASEDRLDCDTVSREFAGEEGTGAVLLAVGETAADPLTMRDLIGEGE